VANQGSGGSSYFLIDQEGNILNVGGAYLMDNLHHPPTPSVSIGAVLNPLKQTCFRP
jgi:hypothetical protein